MATDLKNIAQKIGTLASTLAPTSKGSMSKQQIKTLKHARKQTKGHPGWTGPGNLQRKIKQYNTPERILGNTKVPTGAVKTAYGFTFTLNYAPPGAEYGMFWNDPTVAKNIRHGKTKNIPGAINFAQQAIDNPEIQTMIDDLMNQFVNDNVIDAIEQELDKFDSIE